jgi:hypothetical protein
MAQIILLLQLALSLLNAKPSTTTIAMAMQAVNIAEQVLQNESSTPVVIQPAPIVATSTIATTTQSISANTTTTCPANEVNIIDGPPDPCNPYAFKLSECPPQTGKPNGTGLVITEETPVGIPDLTPEQSDLLAAEKAYCPLPVN